MSDQVMNDQALLIELGTEELPPKALKTLSDTFSKSFTDCLIDAGLLDKQTAISSFATPRRIAIYITSVRAQQADYSQQRKGPAVIAAFDDKGNPTKAAQGFAKSCGVAISELGREKTNKGEWLVFEQTVKGKSITHCAQQALNTAISQLPIPKRMRWGEKNVEFVRPVHWLLALYGSKTLALNALDLYASNLSYGHRFHHPQALLIKHADDYSNALKKVQVMVDYDARQTQIKIQCETLAKNHKGIAVIDQSLLDEVTALVEWPVPFLGEFGEQFLALPREALIASMKDHQKYFYLTDSNNELLAQFIAVSNIQSSAPQKVLSGNERALHLRLSDAQFNWQQDKQHRLEDNANRLENLLYHAKLGSVADKTRRLVSISGQFSQLIAADTEQTQRAASLCKLDLVSQMVGEFARLQGTMGRYYALNDGENSLVADAIEQHYWPKFAGDQLPESNEALALALADRMDTLVGIFATGEKPSGDKDPFALRRSALGVLRMLIEKSLDIALHDLLDITIAAYKKTPNLNLQFNAQTEKDITHFILDRLRAYYTEQGFDLLTFNAVASIGPERAYDFDCRIRAVSSFFSTEKNAATALAAANKRIANILNKNASTVLHYDSALFTQDGERALADKLESLRDSTHAAFASGQYSSGLSALASLQQPVDAFFDEVRVMDNDPAIRNNRLGLLGALRALFLQVADISHLNIET